MRFSIALFMLLLCFFEVVHSLPAPAAKKATIKKVAPKKAAVKKPAAPKVAAAKKPAATAKKPATTAKKPAITAKANNGTAAACPVRKTAAKAKPAKKPRDFLDEFISTIFRRQNEEFVGYHGTNGANAQLYLTAGRKGEGIPVLTSFNGADAELGKGIYITDDIDVARTFATGSAGSRAAKGQSSGGQDTAVICKVEAKSTTTWRNVVDKAFIPASKVAKLVGGVNNPAKLKEQEDLIKCNNMSPATTARFSVLNIRNPNGNGANQMMVPTGLFKNLLIRECFPATVPNDQFGSPTHPEFSYKSLRGAWRTAGDEF